MSRGRLSKLISVVITGVVSLSGLPSMVLADVINAPTYYSVQSDLSYEITTNITSSWINHESIDLVLTNTGSETIHNWYLTFDTPYNIDNIWNGSLYETDGNGTYTITSNGWNQDIHTGESVTVGITFSSDTETELSIDPEWYLLNTQATEVDASQYTLAYTEYSAWETGFTGQLTLTPQVDCQHWELSFTSNREITAASSAVLISEGDNNYAITHDENNMGLFASNAYNFGIQGDNTEDPLELSNVELTAVDLAYHLTDDVDANGVPDYLGFIGSGSIVEPTPTPTPMPTEEPTVIPTNVDSITPTELPTITAAPTTNPIEDFDFETDSDSDGLPDDYEDLIGTDKNNPDSDLDGLLDGVEYYYGYNPLSLDSDGNGINDSDEDIDSDGLSNIDEIIISTEIAIDDSDGDSLSDGEEINHYGTNPILYDTDSDGIGDGDELLIGKNPIDSSDGSTRIIQTMEQRIINDEDPAIDSVDITISLANRIDRVVDVRDYYNIDVYSTYVYGRVGSPLSFYCSEDFDTATVVIHYNEASLGETIENNLGVLWYDEESGFFIIQEQAEVDVDNNTVTVELNHFSTYVLVDLYRWNNPPITPAESIAGSIRTITWRTSGVYYADPVIETNAQGQLVLVGWANQTASPERYENTAWNKYLESHPNEVRAGTVDMRYIRDSWGGLYYIYTWNVYTTDEIYVDNDHDGVPDYWEINGIIPFNRSEEIYTSDIGVDDDNNSDEDDLSDLEEYGDIYIVSKSAIDESVSILLINTDGQEELDVNSSNYCLIREFAEALLNPGQSIAFCDPLSNPKDSDSDDDYLLDDVDATPLLKDYTDTNLGGGEFNPYVYDTGYIHVDNSPLNCNEYGYSVTYGGDQDWFGNITGDFIGDNTGIRLLFSLTGCGIIAVNDILLYLRSGTCTYDYDNYRNSIMETTDLFFNLNYNQYIPIDINELHYHTLVNVRMSFAYAQGTNSVINAFENGGYSSHREQATLDNYDIILSHIEDSLTADVPVVLFESDRLGDGINMYRGDYRNQRFYDGLYTFITDGTFAAHYHYHYVTVTGVIRDNITEDVWLRVQSWGKVYYINYMDFIEYNSESVLHDGFLYFLDR